MAATVRTERFTEIATSFGWKLRVGEEEWQGWTEFVPTDDKEDLLLVASIYRGFIETIEVVTLDPAGEPSKDVFPVDFDFKDKNEPWLAGPKVVRELVKLQRGETE